MAAEWLLGAFLSILGSVCTNFGVNVQKLSQNRNQAKPVHERRSYIQQPFYWVGLFLVIFGSLGDFAALGFAGITIVAPIGSMTLVANIFFGRFFLKEKLSKIDVIGTVLIVIGATLAVSFAAHETKIEYDSDKLRSLYGEPGFQIYAAVIFICLLTLYVIIRIIEPLKNQLLQLYESLEQALKADKKDQVENLRLQIEISEEKYEKYKSMHPFFYCSLSGVCGAQSLLFAKSVMMLLRETVTGKNQFVQPWLYIFLVCLCFFIFSQLHFLAVGLKYFDALYVVPVFQCFFILTATVGGALYFQEFHSFKPHQAALFPIGVIITLTGVYVLSKREMSKSLWERNALEKLALVDAVEMNSEGELSRSALESSKASAPSSRGEKALSILSETIPRLHPLTAPGHMPANLFPRRPSLGSHRHSALKGTNGVPEQTRSRASSHPSLSSALRVSVNGAQSNGDGAGAVAISPILEAPPSPSPSPHTPDFFGGETSSRRSSAPGFADLSRQSSLSCPPTSPISPADDSFFKSSPRSAGDIGGNESIQPTATTPVIEEWASPVPSEDVGSSNASDVAVEAVDPEAFDETAVHDPTALDSVEAVAADELVGFDSGSGMVHDVSPRGRSVSSRATALIPSVIRGRVGSRTATEASSSFHRMDDEDDSL